MSTEAADKPSWASIAIEVWHWLMNFTDWHSWVGIVILVVIAFVGCAAFLRVITWTVGEFATLGARAKKVREYLRSDDAIAFARKRRQQFCTVLRSDLDVIAKAENWNDQWFTDLEAEVEAEGGYYRTPLDLLLKRKTSGYRKEPSLMAAIARSAERCLLLVGEPGSGKSVALRHLARQLAEEGSHSSDDQAKVPLYINLRELEEVPIAELTPDRIQQFVLDNVRRADADTASYLKEKWQEYKDQGIWFFLFDSFDEIPAVLHSAAGSSVLRSYTHAIRQFMDGMGACRGILASREYKGPEAIPWQTLRILALDDERQEDLIHNAVLSPEQKILVRRHLAQSNSSVFRNPLFLSLLCRYVRDNHEPPVHDYDLVSRQIVRLAGRDPDHLRAKYDLSPQALLLQAQGVAALFAIDDALGLSPTWEQLAESHRQRVGDTTETYKMLAALVDVKIGRADVKEAQAGDRRFAFSHRRYQESLFVDFLSAHPHILTITDFLLDPRWREYAVTFLQSQPAAACVNVVEAARELLAGWIDTPSRSVSEEFGGVGEYYLWDNGHEAHLLSLLQQGLQQRNDGLVELVQDTVERLLLPRWQNGDAYDRLRVLGFAALLPKSALQPMIEKGIHERVDITRKATFAAAGFIPHMPAKLQRWVCRRLADDTIFAKHPVDLSKLELIAAKLPSDLHAQQIFSRCSRLRSLLKPSLQVVVPVVRAVYKLGSTIVQFPNDEIAYQTRQTAFLDIIMVNWTFLAFTLCARATVLAWHSFHGPFPIAWSIVALIIVGLWMLQVSFRYFFRAVAGPLNLHNVSTAGRNYVRRIKSLIGRAELISGVVTLILLPCFLFLFTRYPLAVGSSIAAVYVAAGIILALGRSQVQQLNKAIAASQQLDPVTRIMDADTALELRLLLEHDQGKLLTTPTQARSLLRVLELLPQHHLSRPFFSIEPGRLLSPLMSLVLTRCLELEKSAAPALFFWG